MRLGGSLEMTCHPALNPVRKLNLSCDRTFGFVH